MIVQTLDHNKFNYVDISNQNNELEKLEKNDVKEIDINDVLYDNEEKSIKTEEKEDVLLFKNKVDIEKELFDEFNSVDNQEESIILEKENKMNDYDNKLPDISIDEYMKNFDENNFGEQEVGSLFNDDDVFPNIPM